MRHAGVISNGHPERIILCPHYEKEDEDDIHGKVVTIIRIDLSMK